MPRRLAILTFLAVAALALWWALDRPPTADTEAVTRTPRDAPAPALRDAAPAPSDDGEGRRGVAIGDEGFATPRGVPADGGAPSMGVEFIRRAPGPGVTVHGRAVFAHGGPVAGVRLTAVRPDLSTVPWRGAGSDQIFASARTGADGAFELALDPHASVEGSFRLLLAERTPWEDDPRVHAVDGSRPIHVVYEGGEFGILVRDPDGTPASDVELRVSFPPPAARPDLATRVERPRTNSSGRARVRYRGAPAVTVRASAQGGRLGAGPLVFDLDDRLPDGEAVLELSDRGRKGRLAIEVVDTHGRAVPDFAVTIDDGDYFDRRLIHSEELDPDGFATELPVGRRRVRLSWRFRAPRNLYSIEGVEPVWVDLDELEAAEARFQVAMLGGLRLELRRPAGAADELRLFTRDQAAGDSGWREMRSIWRYRPDGSSTSGVTLSEDGTHYLEELAPGWLDLEVRRYRDDEVLQRARVEIVAGRFAELAIEH